MMLNLTNREVAFFVRSRLVYSISGFCRFLDDKNSSADCITVKKNYICLNPNGLDVNKLLGEYLMECVNILMRTSEDQIPDTKEIEESINENIDLFFDITESDDNILIDTVVKY